MTMSTTEVQPWSSVDGAGSLNRARKPGVPPLQLEHSGNTVTNAWGLDDEPSLSSSMCRKNRAACSGMLFFQGLLLSHMHGQL